MIRKWKKFPFSWLLPVLFFAALWLLGTTGIYNDSNQYIAMHIHREPLYSFFLWIFRSLFGETKYLDIVRFLQNGLAAFSVIWLAESLKKRFDFGQWMEALVCLILLAPHIITPVFSASGLVLSNGVISEALGLPLFYLFTAQCMKMVYTRQRGAALSSLLLSLFLSLVRGQMMFTILLWLVFAGAVVIVEKKKLAKRLLICVVCTALAFGTRTLLVKSYNLVFNGYFINNTFYMRRTKRMPKGLLIRTQELCLSFPIALQKNRVRRIRMRRRAFSTGQRIWKNGMTRSSLK